MPDDYPPDSSTTGIVHVGDSATGAIETRGDTDWFKVRLQAGKTYRIDLEGAATGAGTLPDPDLLDIYSTREVLLPGTGDDDAGAGLNSRVLFTPDRYGDVYIGVAAQGHGTGTYKLLVTDAGADDYPAGETGVLDIGGQAQGEIELPGDTDRFAIRLEAVAAGNGSGKLGFNAALAFEADETGTYFIGVEGGGRTGSYTVYVNRFTDECGTSILNSGTVAVGGASTGDIGEPRDRDRFAVELEAGRAYRIEMEGAPTDRGTLTDPYLRGIYFNRALLPGAADDDGGTGLNSRVDFLAPETGIYYIDAGAYSDRTGSYRLSVQEVTDDIPATSDTDAAVTVDGSATGSVEYGGDVDWFAVSLSAGSHIRIDLAGTSTGQGSLEDPVLYGIYDAAGETVAAGNDDGGEGYNSRLEFIAPATTTYYIAAGARAAHTGSYRLSVDEVADDYPASTATGAAVTVGGSSTGTIERPGDADWFVVELIEGSEYRIDLEGWRTDRGSLEDPYLLGIHDLDGELIPGTANDDGGNGLNSRVVFEAAYTGVYYIAAGAFEDYTGGYTLSVVDVL